LNEKKKIQNQVLFKIKLALEKENKATGANEKKKKKKILCGIS
jgi:hypothetical protein